MLIKKITPEVLHAYNETELMCESELIKLTDKIANDTFTPEDQRYYDRIVRLRAENTSRRIKFISDNTPKNPLDRFFTKLIAPLI
jgi:hypothetical protein